MPTERIEHHEPPESVVERLKLAGGTNPYGEAMFRVVWGWDRLVKITGSWGDSALSYQGVETRTVPKYLPGNCWHLEMWRPPEEYGSPEKWGKLGEAVVGTMTIDTAGPFPSRGEWELCYPLTDDLSPQGSVVPLNGAVTELIVKLIVMSRNERISFDLRKAAIRQRMERERQQRINETAESLLDARPSFYDQPTSFATGPKQHKMDTGLWLPPSCRN